MLFEEKEQKKKEKRNGIKEKNMGNFFKKSN